MVTPLPPTLKPPTVSGPTAKRRVITGPDGTPHVVYIDATTGAEVQNLNGYSIISAGNEADLESLGLSPTEDKKEDTVAQETIKSVSPKKSLPSDSDGRQGSSSGNVPSGRNQANNFGYMNKPTGMGLASAIPGPIGWAGKAANTAVNMNNTAAVNAARGVMGLDKQSVGGNIKSTLKDNKGFVADVKAGTGTYPVGLEAIDKRGMTTMTPQEASLRAAANQTKVSLANDDEIAQMERDFESNYGEKKGFLSKATSFIDNMFTSPAERQAKAAEAASRAQNTGSNFSPSRGGFGDMLGAEQSGVGKEATSTPGYGVSGAARSTAGKVSRGGSGSSSGGSSGRSSNPGTSGHMGAGGGTTSGHGPGIGSA
jgi:hypothetical protein